jgi:hypothetical protein
VAEEYREGFMRFIDPENIKNGLSQEPILAYRYLAKREGKEYYEMIRVAGVRDIEERKDDNKRAKARETSHTSDTSYTRASWLQQR